MASSSKGDFRVGIRRLFVLHFCTGCLLAGQNMNAPTEKSTMELAQLMKLIAEGATGKEEGRSYEAIAGSSIHCSSITEAVYTDLDCYLRHQGYYLTPAGTAVYEGYITPKQKEMFIRSLISRSAIQNVAEVGFNAGHTAELFLECIQGSRVVSFDINMHVYTNVGVKFMKMKYGDRFGFVAGDSRYSIEQYAKANSGERFDLIYIDGCHLFSACLDDILNCKALAHKHSILWIDDFHFPDVRKAVSFAAKLRLIEVIREEVAEDEFGLRTWVEARYIL